MSNSPDVCRSCLASDQNLLQMNSIVDDTLKISDCLSTYLNVEVLEDDGLPFTICLRCIDDLLSIRKFHLRYFESVAYLLSCYNSMKEDATKEKENEIIDDFVSVVEETEQTLPEFSETDLNQSETSITFEELEGDWLEEEIEIEEKTDQIEFINIGNSSGKCPLFCSICHNLLTGDKVATYPPSETDSQLKKIVNSQPAQSSTINSQPPRSVHCLQCHEEFPTRNELRTHFHTVHGEDNARGFCTQCEQSFPTRGQLMSHLDSHSRLYVRESVQPRQQRSNSDFQCEDCERFFSTSSHLKAHRRIHTGERPFSCSFCNRAFRDRTVLKTHMTLHTGKTVPCPKCDKKFSGYSYLRVHLRVHGDIRPYACHLCDKKFRGSSHLKSHILHHGEVRAFTCEKCGQSFKDSNCLWTHRKLHTRPFKCSICNYRAPGAYRIKIHLTKVHNVQDEHKQYTIGCGEEENIN